MSDSIGLDNNGTGEVGSQNATIIVHTELKNKSVGFSLQASLLTISEAKTPAF